jgi:hypothetical protein
MDSVWQAASFVICSCFEYLRRNIQVSLQHNPLCASKNAATPRVYCTRAEVLRFSAHPPPHSYPLRKLAETSAKN